MSSCYICTQEIAPGALRRTISTSEGRQPVHEHCHAKYLALAMGEPAPEATDLPWEAPAAQTPTEDTTMGTEVTKYDEKFAEMAAGYANSERVSGRFISTRGGVLTFEDEQLPGNQMCVVVLDYIHERTYYTKKFDSDAESNLPPVCYALHRPEDPEEMAPHPSMQADPSYFQPQHHECRTCPMNEWGTADTGRGKACGERRRLALLPAGYYTPRRGSRDFDLNFITDPAHYEAADIAYLKLPVTSVKEWARYVTQLRSAHHRPPAAVVTHIYIEPDPKSQFKIKFDLIDLLPDTMYETILRRHEEAKGSIIFGYPSPGASEGQAPQGRSIRR